MARSRSACPPPPKATAPPPKLREGGKADATFILRGMMPTRFIAATVLAATLTPARALGDTYPRQPGIDAVHYVFTNVDIPAELL